MSEMSETEQAVTLQRCGFCRAVPSKTSGGERWFVRHDRDCFITLIAQRDQFIPPEQETAWNTRSASVVTPQGDKTNTGLFCNGCGLLIEGWPNVYRCVTRGCGRIYHYQCLLEHCASDHLCQNCKASYKPYVLRCDKCGAEAFDCCLSKPCVKCGSTFAATTPVTAPVSTGRQSETGWLLEKMHNGNVHYISADHVLTWTDDPNKALRLARREDAEALCTIVEDCEKIASHEWVPAATSTTPVDGERTCAGCHRMCDVGLLLCPTCVDEGRATPPPAVTAPGVEAIARERQRHFDVEGWTPEHDDEHVHGELAVAAACYAVEHTDASVRYPYDDPEGSGWPWGERWWKPKDELRNLARAGALVAAEFDRLERLAKGATEKAAPAVTAQVQCADCLAWIDRDANHTCQRQVRSNQRKAAK